MDTPGKPSPLEPDDSLDDLPEAWLDVAFRPGDSPRSEAQGVHEQLGDSTGAGTRVLLREPAQETAPVLHAASDELPAEGTSAGHYLVLGEIARGGMGVILQGRDPDLGRDVALKVLQRKYAEDQTLTERFVVEAQISGQLQHPGIVPVYELGLMGSQRPYFAMKLVKGSTLASLLRAREDPAGERLRFLKVLEQVSQTVAYAHARGVIHRDLKPSNVMVGAFGEVQVMDWGLAKVLAQGGASDDERGAARSGTRTEIHTGRSGTPALESRAGSVMGTVAYMAPEQARGEVNGLDERCDVFSLGAILCEVLTGEPAFPGDTYAEQHGLARKGLVEGAWARLERCGADTELVTIARECLAPDRRGRPAAAGAVAARIGAYLASVEERAQEARDEASAARGRAVAERRARWLTVALSSSVLLSGVCGIVGWRWAENRERTRRGLAELEVQVALDEAIEARREQRLADALSAARRAESLAVAGIVGEEFEGRARTLTDMIAAQEAELKAEADHAAREARFLARLERVRLIEPHLPLDEFEPGYKGGHIGPAPVTEQERTDQWTRRSEAYEAIFAAHDFGLNSGADQLVERIAASEVAEEVALALDDWARVLKRLDGQEQEAHRLIGLARRVDFGTASGRIRDALLEEDDVALLAIASDPDSVAELPAASLFLLGQLLTDAGEPQAAAELLSAGVEAHPDDSFLYWQLGKALLETRPPRLAEAARQYTAARALRPETVGILRSLARSRRLLGEFKASHALLEKAIQIDPADPSNHRQLARTLKALGDLPAALEAQEEALRLDPGDLRIRSELAGLLQDAGEAELALEHRREIVRLNPDSAHSQAKLAHAMAGAGDPMGGLAAARVATEMNRDSKSGTHIAGHVLTELERYEEALEAFNEADALEPPKPGDLSCKVHALMYLGRHEEVRALARELLELRPGNIEARTALAEATLASGDAREAAELCRGILEDRPGMVEARFLLVKIAFQAGQFEQMEILCEEILDRFPARVDALEDLGVARGRLGDPEAAVELIKQAAELRPSQSATLGNLGFYLRECGRPREALEYYRRGLEINPENQGILSIYFQGLAGLKDFDKALEIAERAHALNPDYAGNEARLGHVLYLMEQYSRAVGHLSRAVEQDDEDVQAWEGLGMTLGSLQRAEEAVVALERAVTLGSRSCRAYRTLASLHKWLGDNDSAATVVRDLIEFHPDCVAANKTLADVKLARGSHSEAAEMYRKVLESSPRDTEVLNALAWLLVEAPGREPYEPAEAVALAERFIEIDPTAGYAWNTLGVARYRIGEHAGAIEALERSVELRPGDAWDWLFLAMARHRLGQEEEARAEFERALRWMAGQESVDAELTAVEREARELLGIRGGESSGR